MNCALSVVVIALLPLSITAACSSTNCSPCVADSSCGWCAASSTCFPGNLNGPNPGTCSNGWAFSQSDCACLANYSCNCVTCTSGPCSWCGTSTNAPNGFCLASQISCHYTSYNAPT